MDLIELKNGIRLYGDPARGNLTGIGHGDMARDFRWTAEKPGWNIRIITPEGPASVPREEFSFRKLSDRAGEFTHHTLPLKIRIVWREYDVRAVACNLGFEAGPAVRVDSLGFRLPGRIKVAGETENDYLVYPFKTGIKIPAPAQLAFADFKRLDTKYGPSRKVRHLNVIETGLPPSGRTAAVSEEIAENEMLTRFRQRVTDDEVEWGRDHSYAYPGGIAMTWMDYYGPQGGLYLAAHEPQMEKTLLYFAARRGEDGIAPGIDKIFNRQLTAWNGDFVLAPHDGDWQQGAERYRRYLDQLLPPSRTSPVFFRQAPGTMTHYDLKWEDGTINHRYRDLPAMYREAADLGFNILLLAGWNRGGFDNYELRYQPDPELGTEQELHDAIRRIHELGGKVLLYVNAMCIARDSADFQDSAHEYAVRTGQAKVDSFGDGFLLHPLAIMCNQVEAWRDAVKRNIRYVVLELKADGLYLDQIGSPPRECYAGSHRHRESWTRSYRSLLQEARTELAAAGAREYLFLTEYPMDVYRDLIDGFLCYSYWQSATDLCCPAMFRRTLPETLLIDMVMQKPWAGKDPVESRFVTEIFCRQFIEGVKYWTYCHAPGNPGLEAFFPAAIALYRSGVEFMAGGEYRGEAGLSGKAPGLEVREYRLGNRRLFAIWNSTGEPGWFAPADNGTDGRLVVMDLENPEPRPAAFFAAKRPAVGASRLSLFELRPAVNPVQEKK